MLKESMEISSIHSAPYREVHCQDAIEWLKSQPVLTGSSLVASMPDISEFSLGLVEWKQWFVECAKLILSRCPDDGVVVFYQSDIKYQGTWVDKGYLCQKAAELLGFELLWHKVVCRAPAGITTFGRPAYSHLLCFSRGLRLNDLAKSTPDVFASGGEKTWQRGMGVDTCLFICRFIAEFTASRRVVNPFCGEGSVLAAANHLGLSAIGIERSAKRAEISRRQEVLFGKDGSRDFRVSIGVGKRDANFSPADV